MNLSVFPCFRGFHSIKSIKCLVLDFGYIKLSKTQSLPSGSSQSNEEDKPVNGGDRPVNT